jgi:hypothetical protein
VNKHVRNHFWPGTSGSHLNPNYSRGRDQEDCSSKPAWANSFWAPMKKTHHKKGLVECLKVYALSSNPNTGKKKKKKKREITFGYYVIYLYISKIR